MTKEKRCYSKQVEVRCLRQQIGKMRSERREALYANLLQKGKRPCRYMQYATDAERVLHLLKQRSTKQWPFQLGPGYETETG